MGTGPNWKLVGTSPSWAYVGRNNFSGGGANTQSEGRGLEAYADQLISERTSLIESDEGYSHGYARWIFPYNLKLYEHDNKPREDAVRITRLDASVGLVVLAGYTPRWLEEIK